MLSVHFLPLDKIGLGASGAVYGVVMAGTIVENTNKADGGALATAFCLTSLMTEGVLATAGLDHTEFDELLGLVALGAVALIVRSLTAGNRKLQEAMLKQLGLTAFNIFFEDNVDHWAHVGGMMTGIVLASGFLVGALPRFSASSLSKLAPLGALGAVAAVMVGGCYRAYTEDTLEERLLPNFDVLDSLERYIKFLDLGPILGIDDGTRMGHPPAWVKIPKQ
jgi:hypothetical protein